MQKTIVEAHSIEKSFATVKAVDGLSFGVRKGEIFALLGPNGAGKTTMVRMLLGIIKPDRGAIRFDIGNGASPQPSQVGYLPEDRGLYQDVPVLKTLTYFGIIRRMERSDAEREALRWLERLDLKDRAGEKIMSLSKGNQQKIQFIASIIHSPSIVVLDEPFSGLDPINQNIFLQIIRELSGNGTTVLLSAHQMQLVERIVDRILLMNEGKEILSGTIDEIRTATETGNKVTVQLGENADPAKLYEHPSVQKVDPVNSSKFVLYIRPGSGYSELLKTLGSGYDVQSIHTDQMSLHDIYIATIGGGT